MTHTIEPAKVMSPEVERLVAEVNDEWHSATEEQWAAWNAALAAHSSDQIVRAWSEMVGTKAKIDDKSKVIHKHFVQLLIKQFEPTPQEKARTALLQSLNDALWAVRDEGGKFPAAGWVFSVAPKEKFRWSLPDSIDVAGYRIAIIENIECPEGSVHLLQTKFFKEVPQ